MRGGETRQLLSHLNLPPENTAVLRDEAVKILSRCVPPTELSGTDTGLVIGYVQSGKTMSFTTVAALARDNGYRLIIVISGLTVNLFKQSSERLQQDLQVNARSRRWHSIENPKPRAHQQEVANAIDWEGIGTDLTRQTVLLVVMKNTKHLTNLLELLSPLRLAKVPVLIINDEGDQASLNNRVQAGSESATYARIRALRALIPHHTYIQYTATPQALLLINTIDILSPSFVQVLTPGADYTGGQIFFGDDNRLLGRIPDAEIPSKNHRLLTAPNTLVDAMSVFLIGVAAGLAQGDEDSGNRSMMVHPSKETMMHGDYSTWVTLILQRWMRQLDQPASDPDRRALIERFRLAYDNLCSTRDLLPSDATLPPFQHLAVLLRGAIAKTIRLEVNTRQGATAPVDWRRSYSHIIIGGEVLNRGYTIEGLTVTYMPRGPGVGNADTIQQRARWFGYKASYLGYCRIYLSDDVLWAYQLYVHHEEDIRQRMREVSKSGGSLFEWRRAFFLASDLRPTRSSVLDLPYAQGNAAGGWYALASPHVPAEDIAPRRTLVTSLLSGLALSADTRHPAQRMSRCISALMG